MSSTSPAVATLAQVPSGSQRIEQSIGEKCKDMEPASTRLQSLHDILSSRFGEHSVSLRTSELKRHGTDLSVCDPCYPDLIFYPEDSYQVGWVIKNLPEGVSIVPWGMGTSTEGQTVPSAEGTPTLCLDMHRMRRLLDYNKAALRVTVEAGLDLASLNNLLSEDGLYFPVDPMANATIGGMVGDNSEGLSSFRWGRMASNIAGIKAVLSDGSIVAVKEEQPALLSLFLGTEGTIGVVTEVTLKLQPIPQSLKTVWLCFSRLEEAALAVPRIVREQKGLNKCFLLDGPSIAAIRKETPQWGPSECPSLLLQIEGDFPLVLAGSPEIIKQEESTDPETQEMIWSRLSDAWFAGNDPISTTFHVPINRIAELLREAQGEESISCFGNVASGTVTFISPRNKVDAFRANLFPAVINLDGSVCTMGVGSAKRIMASTEVGQAMLLWHKIKTAVDPKGILNPGTLL